jgi:hypothetical protein
VHGISHDASVPIYRGKNGLAVPWNVWMSALGGARERNGMKRQTVVMTADQGAGFETPRERTRRDESLDTMSMTMS